MCLYACNHYTSGSEVRQFALILGLIPGILSVYVKMQIFGGTKKSPELPRD